MFLTTLGPTYRIGIGYFRMYGSTWKLIIGAACVFDIASFKHKKGKHGKSSILRIDYVISANLKRHNCDYMREY